MKKHHDVDPDKRLLYLLLRHDMELDQAGFAAATRTAAGQVSLYSQGQRDLPEAVLDRAAQACRFPRPLLQPALRAIRSFRAATRGLSRAERVLAETFFTELLALIGSALEAILEPAGPPPFKSLRSPAFDKLEPCTPIPPTSSSRTSESRPASSRSSRTRPSPRSATRTSP